MYIKHTIPSLEDLQEKLNLVQQILEIGFRALGDLKKREAELIQAAQIRILVKLPPNKVLALIDSGTIPEATGIYALKLQRKKQGPWRSGLSG